MAQTALSPTRVQAVGSFTDIMVGLAGGSGTSTVVTLAPGIKVEAVGVCGATSTTAVFCATVSATTFTVTHASNDLFFWIAKVKGGV
jgi:hypothetical protein